MRACPSTSKMSTSFPPSGVSSWIAKSDPMTDLPSIMCRTKKQPRIPAETLPNINNSIVGRLSRRANILPFSRCKTKNMTQAKSRYSTNGEDSRENTFDGLCAGLSLLDGNRVHLVESREVRSHVHASPERPLFLPYKTATCIQQCTYISIRGEWLCSPIYSMESAQVAPAALFPMTRLSMTRHRERRMKARLRSLTPRQHVFRIPVRPFWDTRNFRKPQITSSECKYLRIDTRYDR